MDNKEWKIIPNYNNYMISSDGDIKSLITGKVMKQHVSSVGYKAVRLTLSSKNTKLIHTHRLVAITFLEFDETSDYVVDHIDNNRLNNNVSNLQIVSRRLNNTKEFTSKSGFPGVYSEKDRVSFRARIKINGKYVSLGNYKTPNEAYYKYMEALKDIDPQAYNYYKSKFN